MNTKLLIKILLNIFSLLIVSYIIPGFTFSNLWSAIVTAIIMGAVNTFIRPVLQILFIPLTIITFGISAFLINVVLLWGVSYIVPGFEILNFLTAVWASIALSFVSWFLNRLGDDKRS